MPFAATAKARTPLISLEEFRHPQNASVILAPNLAVFKAAARDPKWGVVILNKRNAAQEIAQWNPVLFNILRNGGFANKRNIPNGHKNVRVGYGYALNGRITADYMMSEFKPIGPLLNKMARLFNELSGSRFYNLHVGRNFDTALHKHDFNVLNVTFGGDGTIVLGPSGGQIKTREGQWLYLKKSIWHLSPPGTDPPRFTLGVADYHG